MPDVIHALRNDWVDRTTVTQVTDKPQDAKAEGELAVGSRYRGVTGIPHTILFAPDGTILSRRIISSKELDKKLKEIFGD